MFLKMAHRIAGLQQADGTWHANMLNPKSFPVKESSGTGFFTYALTGVSIMDIYLIMNISWLSIKHGTLYRRAYMKMAN